MRTYLLAAIAALSMTACAPSQPPATAVPAPGQMLGSGEWKVTAINGTPVVPSSKVTIEFKDGRVFGAGSCNRFMGGYQAGDQLKITMSQMASTMMACPEPLMAQEGVFLKALGGVTGYSVAGDVLTLTGPDGTITASRA